MVIQAALGSQPAVTSSLWALRLPSPALSLLASPCACSTLGVPVSVSCVSSILGTCPSPPTAPGVRQGLVEVHRPRPPPGEDSLSGPPSGAVLGGGRAIPGGRVEFIDAGVQMELSALNLLLLFNSEDRSAWKWIP